MPRIIRGHQIESEPEVKKRTQQLFEADEWTAAFKLSKIASQRPQLGRDRTGSFRIYERAKRTFRKRPSSRRSEGSDGRLKMDMSQAAAATRAAA